MEPTHVSIGMRTALSAPGTWKNPVGGASSARRVNRLSGGILTCRSGPGHSCAPARVTRVVAPIECPTPTAVAPGGTKASSARVKRLAREVSSASLGAGDASRLKCGATTVHPDSTSAPRSVAFGLATRASRKKHYRRISCGFQ